MCTVLGLSQSWWVVIGLLSDFAGFSMLALDVLREYGRRRLIGRLRAGAGAARRLRNDEVVGTATTDETTRAIDRATMHLALQRVRADYDPYNVGPLAIAEAELFTRADAIAMQPMRPAPIYTGVVLVLLGLLLQVVGSLPAPLLCGQ
jgi:hypothetical protein